MTKGKRTPKIIAEILNRVALGESVNKICGKDRDARLPSTVLFYEWLNSDTQMASEYERAREARAEAVFEEMLDIADDGTNDYTYGEDGPYLDAEHVKRSRLRIDTRKWMLSRMMPRKYGEKLDVNHSGGIAVTGVEVTFVRADTKPKDA